MWKNALYRYSSIVLAVFFIHGLVSGQGESTASSDVLAGTSWRLVSIQSMDDAIGTVRPENPDDYTLRLNEDSTFNMRLNCNSANGSWSAEPSADGSSGRFRFGRFVATKVHCPPPSLDQQIASQAAYIRSFLLKDGKLYLSLMADGGIYAWKPVAEESLSNQVPRAPEDGGPRDWEVSSDCPVLNLREQPSVTSRVVAKYTPGTILDNLGCRQAEGRTWCDVQELGGGPRGFVAAEYLEPAVSPDGSVAMGPDDSALRAGQKDFDATGQMPCAQFAGQPMTQCEFGVARAGGGYATVVVTRPDGMSRAIFFRMGKPIGADISQAAGDIDFSATKESDLHIIRIGYERYEIPDAVIFGD